MPETSANMLPAEDCGDPYDALRKQLNLNPGDFDHLIPTIVQLAKWVLQRRQARFDSGVGGAYTLGITGGQGSGKTTIRRLLEYELQQAGLRTAGFSLDDIYKTLAEREKLQQTCPHYRFRGLFGTHDVGLGMSTLHSLKHGSSGTAQIPVFEKSIAQGKGDRLPLDVWHTAELPVDVVIFEGWCIGAQPVSDAELGSPCCPVESNPKYDDADGTFRQRINTELREYQALFGELSDLLVLHVPQIEAIHNWRLKQEALLRAQTGSGMDGELVARFVEYYIPSTIRYVLPLGENPVGRADLVLALDNKHRITTIKEVEGSTLVETAAADWVVGGRD